MNNWIKITALIFLFCASLQSMAQDAVQYKIKGKLILAIIQVDQPVSELDSIVKTFGFKGYKGIDTAKSAMSWYVQEHSATKLILVFDKNRAKELPPAFVLNDADVVKVVPSPFATYGVNDFKKKHVRTDDAGTTFFIEGYTNASEVYLAGSFNEWSTLNTPMQKTKSGWTITLHLPEGKHLYKYIIDGEWKHDKFNRLKEPDGNRGYNSIYFVYNYTFKLSGYSNANSVFVAGSFANWSQLKMRWNSKSEEWFLPMYVREGTHAYKFIVDDTWITDPANSIVRNDGAGNQNSFMSVGDTFYFELEGYPQAEEVFVGGDFNGWNFGELKMQLTDTGWVLPYVLAAGNYEYKFRVGDRYILDESNPVTNGSSKYKNSVLCVKPNHLFELAGYANSDECIVTGSFNGWSETGYTMKIVKGKWQVNVYLPKGKNTYKFKADDEWLPDPENPLWERNEYNSRNSIIWIDDYQPQASN